MNPKITYTPEWIAKILSGQKTMTIRRTQYPCGVYDVVSEAEPDKVVCRIEVVRVEKVNMDHQLKRFQNLLDGFRDITDIVNACFSDEHNYSASCGFIDIVNFIQYHRENYAPVKFAHTFELLKGESNA